MKLLKLGLLAVVVNILFSCHAFASKGTVILAKGVVTASSTDKTSRVLAKNAPVEEGDIINTASKSFAVIRMIDNTKLTLKPNTTIAIGTFNDEIGKEEACINLVKGGLRTVTGLIGKRKPESFKVDTPIASIGIRGTDFIVRICAGEECLNDEQELAYGNYDGSATPGTGNAAEPTSRQIPEGLYGSCETGAIFMTQCAGQSEEFQLGSCRTAQKADCSTIELPAGKAGFAGIQSVTTDSPNISDNNISALPKVPLIMTEDPYFALSDLSDAELDEIDRFPEGFNPQGECSIYGG